MFPCLRRSSRKNPGLLWPVTHLHPLKGAKPLCRKRSVGKSYSNCDPVASLTPPAGYDPAAYAQYMAPRIRSKVGPAMVIWEEVLVADDGLGFETSDREPDPGRERSRDLLMNFGNEGCASKDTNKADLQNIVPGTLRARDPVHGRNS